MATNIQQKTEPRIGLIGCAELDFNAALITPIESVIAGSGNVAFDGVVSPAITMGPIDASGNLIAKNYDGLSSLLSARAIPIQTINNQSETAWFLDNLGSGSECCEDTISVSEYTTILSGFSYEIPRSVHGISGFPTVTVLTSTGTEVSVCISYAGESIFVTSNVLMDFHTAILR